MTYAAPMIRENPDKPYLEAQSLTECIQACFDCAQACTADIDADLGETHLQEMVRCIRLCLDCADLCLTTGRILSRQSTFDPVVVAGALRATVQASKTCGDECEDHARHGMAHCQTCLEACRRCERACNILLASLPA